MKIVRQLRVPYLLLCLVVFAIGCGSSDRSVGSSNSNVAVSQSTPPLGSAVVEGFVVQGSLPAQSAGAAQKVFVVSSPTAIDGTTPAANAIVRMTDAMGQLTGMALTANDGSFRLDTNQTMVSSQLDVRLSLAATTPDLLVRTAIVPGENKAAFSPTVTREKAIELARPFYQAEELVALTSGPLPQGCRVELGEDPLNEGQPGFQTVLTGPSWLAMIDPEPLSFFGHPVRFLLIDATSGDVQEVATNSFARVNGAPMWATLDELFDTSNLDPLDPNPPVAPALADVVQIGSILGNESSLPQPQQVEPDIRAQNSNGADGVFALLVVGNDSYRMEAGARKLAAFLRAQGVPDDHIIVVSARDQGTFASFKGTRDRKTLINEIQLGISLLQPAIADRNSKNLPSTFIYYSVSHGVGTGIQLANESLNAGTTINTLGIFKTGACRTRVLIEACESGGFGSQMASQIRANATLSTQDIVIYTAADSKRASGNTVVGPNWTRGVIAQGSIQGGDLVGLADFTANPPVVTGALAQVSNFPLVGKLQNPLVFVANSSPTLCPSATETEPTPVDQPPKGDATIKFVNQANERVTLRLESANTSLNDGAPVSLAPVGQPGSIFEESVGSNIRDLKIIDFNPPSGAVKDVGAVWQVPAGTTRTITWQSVKSGRSLFVDQRSATAGLLGE